MTDVQSTRGVNGRLSLNSNEQHVRQDLYRFYDANHRLLYIGISLNAAMRASQHRAEKPWWPEVARMEVAHYELMTRGDLLDIERDAILAEKPLYNVTHNSASQRPPIERPPMTRPATVGDVVALGCRDGSCPVGMITADLEDGFFRLDLYSWISEYFGCGDLVLSWQWVLLGKVARKLTAAEKRQDGFFGSGDVFDMDPLGDFQGQWAAKWLNGQDVLDMEVGW